MGEMSWERAVMLFKYEIPFVPNCCCCSPISTHFLMGFLSKFCRKDNWTVLAKMKKNPTKLMFCCFLLAGGRWGDIAYFIPSKTGESFIHFCVMQLSGHVAPQENLGAHWQPQNEMLLCKFGTKETKKIFQTPPISHGAWKLLRHITPPEALIFPHGSSFQTLFLQFCFSLH